MEVAAKLKINGELTMIQIEDRGKSCRNMNLHKTLGHLKFSMGFENIPSVNAASIEWLFASSHER